MSVSVKDFDDISPGYIASHLMGLPKELDSCRGEKKKRENEKENTCKCAAARALSPGIYGYVVSGMRQCQACSSSSFEPRKFVRTLMRIMTSMHRAGCDCTLLGPVSFGRNEEEGH